MGAPYEFNWYLVVANEEEIKEVGNNKFLTVKSDQRIYPIKAEIPLILKKKGCIGLVRILSFTVTENETNIEFEYKEKYDIDNVISKHYYNMYLEMKNR